MVAPAGAAMLPALTHGDLTPDNILTPPDGRAALIDPAASYGWPEGDVSMIYCLRGDVVHESYFPAYHETSPPQVGWQERVPLIYLQEPLSLPARFPDQRKILGFAVPLIEHVIGRFAGRSSDRASQRPADMS